MGLMKLQDIQTELFSSVFSHLLFQYLIPLQEYCPHVQTFHVKETYWIIERERTSGFRRIFTVAFLLFLDPAGGSIPADNHEHLPNLT